MFAMGPPPPRGPHSYDDRGDGPGGPDGKGPGGRKGPPPDGPRDKPDRGGRKNVAGPIPPERCQVVRLTSNTRTG